MHKLLSVIGTRANNELISCKSYCSTKNSIRFLSFNYPRTITCLFERSYGCQWKNFCSSRLCQSKIIFWQCIFRVKSATSHTCTTLLATISRRSNATKIWILTCNARTFAEINAEWCHFECVANAHFNCNIFHCLITRREVWIFCHTKHSAGLVIPRQ